MIRRRHVLTPLAALPLFADSDAADLRAASRLLTEIRLDAGQVLIREGEAGSECFIIGEGAVDVTRTDGGERRVLAVVGAGGVLGEMSMLHHTPRTATVTTLEPTTVYVANRREFFSLLDAVPSVAQKIIDGAELRAGANAAA